MKKTKRPTLEQLQQFASTIAARPIEAPIKEQYACPSCDELHDDSYDAADCCRWSIDAVYVCTACPKDEREPFGTENECQEHIDRVHGIMAASIEDVTERYLNALREGTASRQWEFEMLATTEFLIPVDMEIAA